MYSALTLLKHEEVVNMLPQKTTPIGTRVIAIGFIIVILSGHFILSFKMTGSDIPAWMMFSFWSGVLVAVAGGVSRLWDMIRN